VLGGPFIDQKNPRHRPFREISKELYARYQRPFLIAETGSEDELRPKWFRYVGTEARAALEDGVELMEFVYIRL